ncbi:sugar-binding protein [Arsenicicoccus sp. oral taxon 190]|uniref:sugar-binding protein n=1 Tax=Arsenicicoccus sp. oral taxon 190 TaxID=1658671 RepID=UPI0009E393B5|nr:sugar-binding protein [Arsenicicoccus sp. oral taxon 190]
MAPTPRGRQGRRTARTTLAAVTVALTAGTTAIGSAIAAPAGDGHGDRTGTLSAFARGPQTRDTSIGTPVDLGLLYVGAHPDDEAGTLSTLGLWRQRYGVKAGVITITRGEGGGNAVGPEEGPALGLLREAEERRAVGKAGISNIYNLDKVDFYYTVSEPLTRKVWGHDDTLARAVRVIRQTRPEVLMTMDPAPSPGNHGNHQEAARIAVEAFYAAGDPGRFPDQVTKEGLKPWAPSRLLTRSYSGTSSTGPTCGSTLAPKDPTRDVYGVWGGERAPDGRTWAAVERSAQREYVTQGWAGFPDVPSDPAKIGCDTMTQIASRVPIPEPGSAAATAADGAIAGALTRPSGALPLGTGATITTAQADVQPGGRVAGTLTVTAPARQALTGLTAQPVLPAGWTVQAGAVPATVRAGATVRIPFTLSAPAAAATGARARIALRLKAAQGSGYVDQSVLVAPAVTAHQQWLPQVEQFEAWTREVGVPQLSGTVAPVLTLASGGRRGIRVDLTNNTQASQSGQVTLTPPAGFTVEPASRPYTLAAGATGSVEFTVTNTDASLKTGAPGGDYAYTLTTTSSTGTSTGQQALELVPQATAPQAKPTLDGVIAPGEYPGAALDVSRRWEGDECTSAADCSAQAWVSWDADTLYVAVKVTDDVKGTALATNDCKRHWRTDSLEIAVDPRGTSENTSTTFKAAILPFTAEGPACGLRDADNHQGPAASTAPGMRWAVKVNEPYTGYTAEVAIPMSELPAAVDPNHMGLNILPYDSDTQDKTGQTRIGWSVWGGVQGDPYRWGQVRLDGYTPPAGRSTTPTEPVIPLEALSSLDSPQSVAQAVVDNVALAGGPSATLRTGGWVESVRPAYGEAVVTIRAAAAGVAHVSLMDASGVLGKRTVEVPGRGKVAVRVPVTRPAVGTPTALVGWDGPGDSTLSSSVTPSRPRR